MKKLLTLSMAAALAFGAMAAGRQQMSVEKLTLDRNNFRSEVSMQKKHLVTPARVRALQNFEGDYEWERFDNLDYMSVITSTLKLTLTDAATGEFKLTGFGYNIELRCYIDPVANTMTLPSPQEFTDLYDDNNAFYVMDQSWDDGPNGDEAAVGYIDGKVITFPDSPYWVISNYPDNTWSQWYRTSQNTLTFLGEIIDNGGDVSDDPIEGIDRIAGIYDMTYSPLLNGMGSSSEVTITVTDPTTGEVAITGIAQIPGITIPIKGVFSPSDNTLTIPNKQFLGTDTQYGDPTFFYIKPVVGSQIGDGASSAAATVGVMDANNVITFPELDVWAIGDINNENAGFWFLSYQNVMIGENIPDDPNEGWEDYCNATFEDGWIVPGLYNAASGDYLLPSDCPWTIKVQRNIENPNLLRLDNPYTAEECPIPAEITREGGYIVINIEKPDFVSVTPGIFMGVMNGSTKLMALNFAGFYSAAGYTQQEIEAGVTGYEPSTYNAETGVIYLPLVGFNFAGASSQYYTWIDEYKNSLAENMNSKITLDKVEGIDSIASAKAPVVYYNLQGQRIDNPSNGIFIRVEGGKSVKVIK